MTLAVPRVLAELAPFLSMAWSRGRADNLPSHLDMPSPPLLTPCFCVYHHRTSPM